MRRLFVLAALAAIGLAGPVRADPTDPDADFVATLDKAGITYRSPQQAVAAAKQVCALMGRGQTGPDVVRQMTQANPGFAEAGAEQFTAIAASAYCPQYIVNRGGGAGGD
ncbi:DUF732 domain-containing protein [Mycobacterium sp.]|uniref:DUF732 domain-containing protein n=1 Tax=Mycobacterium sp. TaxID=1785 RepID=UPI001287561D|nr:DUF732 domain-containing protein [Mycobacterium sp.]KAA8958226.1 MAG: DUF732 domain-containing protein [Mycobacterium sp.]